MQSIRERARQLAPFDELTDVEFDSLSEYSLAMMLPAGETICVRGGASDAAYLLVAGEVVEQWPDGIVTHRKPGSLLISTALLSAKPCDHSWTVQQDAAVLRIARGDFETLLSMGACGAQQVLVSVTRNLASQLRDLNHAFSELQSGH